ncbi:LbtU family siderophore porin [Imhoffiella purpurea]
MSMLPAAIALALASQTPAQAESVETRLERLEAQNRSLAAQVKRQEAEIAEHRAQLKGSPERLKAVEEGMEEDRLAASLDDPSAWFRNIEISGLIEVEGSYLSPFEGDTESDLILATVELGISSQINDWVLAGISFLYEEDDTDLEVDTGYITIANPDVTPLFLTAGQIYVPFGAYETNLVSDPLTLEIGETRETALQIGFAQGDFSGSVYAFNGDNKVKGKNRIDSWGANLGYAHEEDDRAWAFGVGYINDLGDSDSLQDLINENRVAAEEDAIAAGIDTSGYSVDPTDRTAGWTVNAAASFGPFNLIGEYLSATDDYDPVSLSYKDSGAKPSAWNIEAGYSFSVMGRESVAAVAYQGTDEALGLELPKERWMLGWSVEVYERTALSLEWAHDRDYSGKDGGTGKSADTIIAQLAVEF